MSRHHGATHPQHEPSPWQRHAPTAAQDLGVNEIWAPHRSVEQPYRQRDPSSSDEFADWKLVVAVKP
jgi:hypothetical protein